MMGYAQAQASWSLLSTPLSDHEVNWLYGQNIMDSIKVARQSPEIINFWLTKSESSFYAFFSRQQ